jgi:dUTP pyrophosphatase
VKIKLLTNTAKVPEYKTAGSACFDLVADEDIFIYPQSTVAIKTGLAMEIPEGFKVSVLPRSGMSLKTHLEVIIGTIDSDYRGEVKVIMRNTLENKIVWRHYYRTLEGNGEALDEDDEPVNFNTYLVHKGDRIAQAELVPVTKADFEVVDELSTTERLGGFGSTGIRG